MCGISVLIFCFSGMLSAQIQRPESKPFKIEVGINFGSTLGYSITGSSYSDSWDGYDAFDVSESGTLSPELSTPLSFGGNISLITGMGVGLQLALDYNTNSDMTGMSTYDVTHSDHFTYYNRQNSSEWDITGSASMMVVSLNFIYKYQGEMFSPWFAAGGSYYSGSIDGSSNVGFGFEEWWLTPINFDYIRPAVEFAQDLSGIGFNVGGGFDINFSPSVAFTLEARYFILGESEINWASQTGDYKTAIYDLNFRLKQDKLQLVYMGNTFDNPKYWTSYFTGEFAGSDYLDSLIGPLTYNPSFPKIAAGFKFSF